MKTYKRNFRHSQGYAGTAALYCDIRGENNYVVFCHIGCEQDKHSPPSDLVRGGVDAAREAWARIQARLIGQGYKPLGTIIQEKGGNGDAK